MRSPSFKLVVTQDYQCSRKDEDIDNDAFYSDIVAPSIEELLIKNEMRECFLEFVNKLEFNKRIVFVLSDLIGMSDKRISEILNLPLSTIKIRLHRARLKLKKELEIHCGLIRDTRNKIMWEGKRL